MGIVFSRSNLTCVQLNIKIVRALAKMRRLLGTPGELGRQIARFAETVDLHDEQIKAILSVLTQMTSQSKKQEMGFHTIGKSRMLTSDRGVLRPVPFT